MELVSLVSRYILEFLKFEALFEGKWTSSLQFVGRPRSSILFFTFAVYLKIKKLCIILIIHIASRFVLDFSGC